MPEHKTCCCCGREAENILWVRHTHILHSDEICETCFAWAHVALFRGGAVCQKAVMEGPYIVEYPQNGKPITPPVFI